MLLLTARDCIFVLRLLGSRLRNTSVPSAVPSLPDDTTFCNVNMLNTLSDKALFCKWTQNTSS